MRHRRPAALNQEHLLQRLPHGSARTFRQLFGCLAVGALLFGSAALSANSSWPLPNDTYKKTIESVDEAAILVSEGRITVDLIVVLGGGPPIAPRRVLPFVEERCDAARRLYDAQVPSPPKILCVSAGTAHARQLLRDDGLPVWESTAAAAYLMDLGVPPEALLVETTSYDTIGNAYFARTTHTDVAGFRRLCIVTTDWHMDRARAIFDWVFQTASAKDYDITYLATPSVGLADDAVMARRDREAASLAAVRRLAIAYPTLKDIHTFLTTEHALYTASKLADMDTGDLDPHARASYGAAIDKAPKPPVPDDPPPPLPIDDDAPPQR